MSTAVLLIAHGSRRKEADDDLHRLVEIVRARGTYEVVEPAFLELASPDIPEGAAACVGQGASEVLMMPYFLSMGRHVAEDLSEYRDQFEHRFPDVRFKVCPPLGLHEKLIDVVLDRLGEVTEPSQA